MHKKTAQEKAMRNKTVRHKLLGSVLIGVCLLVTAWASGGFETQAAPAAAEAETDAAAGVDDGAMPGCTVDFSSSKVDGSKLWTDLKIKSGQGHPANCNFHNLAWNNFLYLVDDDGSGHPRFMSLAPWYDLLPAEGTPTWNGSYQQLKLIEIVKSDIHQLEGEAGDDFELLDVTNRSSGYDMRVNKAFFVYSTQMKLYRKSGLAKAADAFNDAGDADGGVWLPAGSDSAVGAIEIKTAWRSYATTADCPKSIMHCETAADGSVWGLVGMHLVQKTPTRGELIWASFEHVANAPDCSPTATVIDPDGSKVTRKDGSDWPSTTPIAKLPPKPGDDGGTISQGWNYFDYSTYQKNGGDGTTCTFPDNEDQPATGQQCNTDPVTSISDGVMTFQRIDTCRTDALPAVDADACKVNVANALNVSCLNDSVLAHFPAHLDSKWKYYQSIGAEWMGADSVPTTGCFTYTPGGPTCPPKTSEPYPDYPLTFQRAGTKHLANTTMETWMQKDMGGIYKAVKSGEATTATYVAQDCFSCHQPISTSWGEGDTSHVFTKTTQD